MIGFNISFVNSWNRKIVYAPNGFGKTTNAIKIHEYITSQGGSPLLFTRKRIESLVENYGNAIYFGDTANNAKNNEKINKEYAESNAIKQFFKQNYSSIAINKLKQMSLFFRISGIKKLDVFSDIVGLEFGDTAFFSLRDAVNYDKLLDADIFYEAKNLINIKSTIKKQKVFKTIKLVDESIIEYLDELRVYIEKSEDNRCPLCGKHFSTKEKLLEAVSRRRKKYRVLDTDNTYNLLCSLVDRIYQLFTENNFGSDAFAFNAEQTDTIKGMLDILADYIVFCNKTIDSMLYYLGNIEIKTAVLLKDIKNQYLENQSKISKERTNIKNVSGFTNFIIKEIRSIVYVDSNLAFLPVPNKLEITVYKDNLPVNNIYDFLSESEIKRFSLVVLRAMIKYGQHNTLILDDPIDSYDDYYMLVACNYINCVVNETKLTNWFILTNNFTALSSLSQILKCDSLIYYYSPDTIFTNNDFSIDCFASTFQEVSCISKNELQLLRDYLKGSLNVDSDLAYIAFIVTLRNFKSLVLTNYDKLLIKTGRKVAGAPSRYDTDSNYQYDVKVLVEHYYMHYDFNTDSTFGIDSNTLEISRIIDLYNRVCKAKQTLVLRYAWNSGSLCLLRETVSKTPFTSLAGSRLINLVLMKICIVSYLKYEFEKLLIQKLITKYSYAGSDIQLVIDSQSLGKKIDKAKELSRNKLYGAELFLKEFNDIYEENRLLFNLFDHGLEQMFPPYIATNVKDIKRFRLEIDNLNSKY